MKLIPYLLLILLFLGCSKTPQISNLPNWQNEDYDVALSSFINNCKSKKTKNIYKELCQDAIKVKDSKLFFQDNFIPSKIDMDPKQKESLLTGYYEPKLKGSVEKSDIYKYPIFKTPNNLITVDLSSIYPELKNYRLRGKLKNNTLIPYDVRGESNLENSSEIICYVDSKIDLFFLEIQGSGRVILEDDKTIYIGYANQNGHKYRAIGRYLVKLGELKIEDVSLQSIRKWLINNPSRVDEVLNYNRSLVFFDKRDKAASGSLGLELTPKRSIAVDRKHIPLGTMLYLDSQVDNKKFSKIVMAQDTGGAIKGAVRADLFLGYGEDAMKK